MGYINIISQEEMIMGRPGFWSIDWGEKTLPAFKLAYPV